MMPFFHWAGEHPYLFVCVLLFVFSVCELVFKTYNRVVRHFNIRAKGWPPTHLDADGDGIKQQEPEQP